MIYWPKEGGQKLEKLIFTIPGVPGVTVAVESVAPAKLVISLEISLEVAPAGVNLYPVFDSVHCVQFLPGATTPCVLL